MSRNRLRKSREMTDEQRDRNAIAERLRDAAASGRLQDVVNMIALHCMEMMPAS